jgi:hypothetical protein
VLAGPPRRGELLPGQLGGVDLDDDLGVEVEPGVEVEVGVGAAGEAVRAGVAAAIWDRSGTLLIIVLANTS